MPTEKYPLNAYVAFLIGIVGFVGCIVVAGLTRFVLSRRAAELVAFGLIISFFAFLKSTITITPGSERSLRSVGTMIGVIAILLTFGLLIYLNWAR